MRKPRGERGRLRIGNDWNAITIIALSQTNPLKAIAEFVENSIDAAASNVTIIRGKEKGEHYLKVFDDGQGLPRAEDGAPDFKYVATHICDSLKRQLKEEGVKNIQGEFGIGLLSFWTIGRRLKMASSGKDGRVCQMEMEKGRPGYSVTHSRRLIASKGTQVTVAPLLEGIRMLSGEKMHSYLASELRDRIRGSGVKIKIIDRHARAEFMVEPRKYSGRLLHGLPQLSTPMGDIYAELYLNEKSADNAVSLFRSGTRVLPSVAALDEFQGEPWSSGYFQGIIDASFLSITPGTRDGIIRDEKFASFLEALRPLNEHLGRISAEQERAEEETVSKNILKSVQKAIKDAMYALPSEEYGWFEVSEAQEYAGRAENSGNNDGILEDDSVVIEPDRSAENETAGGRQKDFFEFAGPLFSARIRPGSAIVECGKSKSFRGAGLDQRRRHTEDDVSYTWAIADGDGSLDKQEGEIVVFTAPQEPGLCRLKLIVRQKETAREAEAIITTVKTLVDAVSASSAASKGLPGYTLESAAGQVWRSRYDTGRNIIVINSGHRDYVYSSAQKARKLRYICRLFTKELILHNFVGSPANDLLERLVELSMYTEENLK
jgi:hypothetical protein